MAHSDQDHLVTWTDLRYVTRSVHHSFSPSQEHQGWQAPGPRSLDLGHGQVRSWSLVDLTLARLISNPTKFLVLKDSRHHISACAVLLMLENDLPDLRVGVTSGHVLEADLTL